MKGISLLFFWACVIHPFMPLRQNAGSCQDGQDLLSVRRSLLSRSGSPCYDHPVRKLLSLLHRYHGRHERHEAQCDQEVLDWLADLKD